MFHFNTELFSSSSAPSSSVTVFHFNTELFSSSSAPSSSVAVYLPFQHINLMDFYSFLELAVNCGTVLPSSSSARLGFFLSTRMPSSSSFVMLSHFNSLNSSRHLLRRIWSCSSCSCSSCCSSCSSSVTVSHFNTLKTVTLLVHAGYF